MLTAQLIGAFYAVVFLGIPVAGGAFVIDRIERWRPCRCETCADPRPVEPGRQISSAEVEHVIAEMEKRLDT